MHQPRARDCAVQAPSDGAVRRALGPARAARDAGPDGRAPTGRRLDHDLLGEPTDQGQSAAAEPGVGRHRAPAAEALDPHVDRAVRTSGQRVRARHRPARRR